MLQDYYRNKAKHYSDELKKYNKKYLGRIENFNDAVKKYMGFKNIYDKAAYYIGKLHYGSIDSVEDMYSQIEANLDGLFNEKIISALKSETERDCFNNLKILECDLKSSYGFGFDTFISNYYYSLYEILKNYGTIYKNYQSSLKNENSYIDSNLSDDPLYGEVVEFCIESGKVSASLIQRRFRLGYNRAAFLLDELEKNKIIGPQIGSKPRDVLVNNNVNDFIPKSKIDYVKLYGTDYDAIERDRKEKERIEQEEYIKFIDTYPEMAQSFFDARGLNIKFNNNKRINVYKINNMLFTNTTSDDVESFVNRILSMSVPNEVKLILIDFSQINLLSYNGLSNLLEPVIYDYKKANILLDSLKKEMANRYDIFLNNKVKNIESYNEKKDNHQIMPYYIVVINELFELLKFENTRDIISELLLNCKRAGILIIGFSKFNKKNIQLMMLEDLFEIHNGYSSNYLDLENTNNTKEIDSIDNDMDGFDFEKYTGELLKANGFTKVEVTQCSGDFGVDVIAYKDDIKYAIQCKKYSSPVGVKAVQEVIGSKSMNGCHVAVVLTNNTFTKQAIELAEKNNVLLWNRDKLIELINNYNK